MDHIGICVSVGKIVYNIWVQSHCWEWGGLLQRSLWCPHPWSFLVPFPPESPQPTCHECGPSIGAHLLWLWVISSLFISSTGSGPPRHQLRVKCCLCTSSNVVAKVAALISGIRWCCNPNAALVLVPRSASQLLASKPSQGSHRGGTSPVRCSNGDGRVIKFPTDPPAVWGEGLGGGGGGGVAVCGICSRCVRLSQKAFHQQVTTHCSTGWRHLAVAFLVSSPAGPAQPAGLQSRRGVSVSTVELLVFWAGGPATTSTMLRWLRAPSWTASCRVCATQPKLAFAIFLALSVTTQHALWIRLFSMFQTFFSNAMRSGSPWTPGSVALLLSSSNLCHSTVPRGLACSQG